MELLGSKFCKRPSPCPLVYFCTTTTRSCCSAAFYGEEYAAEVGWRYFGNPVIRKAGEQLKADLDEFIGVVLRLSEELDDQKTPYLVLDPRVTASSIVI